MTHPYLSKLNPQQRRAVEHGGSSLAEAGPLLIIAGAGSGSDIRQMQHLAKISRLGGEEAFEALLQEMSRRRELSEKAAVRAALRRLREPQ
jgi:DNA helicase II / ATP-dependent DNA helicase PcrA